MTSPSAPPVSPPPTPTAPPPALRGAERFFLWVGGLGVARSDGWLGGVCAGVAARLRIDPLIVRGVLVVATLFGLPLVFVYAVAWALLPDVDGKIHLRELLHGRFDAAQLGILAMVVIAFLPIPSVFGFFFGSPFGGQAPLTYLLSSGAGVIMTFFFLVGLALAVVLFVLIVRAARRTPGAQVTDQRWASAAPSAPDTSATSGDSGVTVADERGVDAPDAAAAAVAASTPADSDGDLDAWREKHAAWKEQDQQWRRQQQDADRAARDQARRERQAEAARFSAEAARRRRIRRASNPRASLAYVAAVLGLALVAGAAVGLWGDANVGIAVGLFVAALVCAAGMVLAGMLRRRSGALALLTVLALVGGGVATAVTTAEALVIGGAGFSNTSPVHVRQPVGYLDLRLKPLPAGERNAMTVQKTWGDTSIDVPPGVTLDLDASLGQATAIFTTMRLRADGTSEAVGDGDVVSAGDGERRVQRTVSSPPADAGAPVTVQHLSLDQQFGYVYVTTYEPVTKEDAQ